MRKIFFRDIKGKKFEVSLVRYFKYKNDYYLVYTKEEKDEKDFMKLYVVKIMEELGLPVSKYMADDNEWQEMQEIIREMIKEIKTNSKSSCEDINPTSIEGISISEARSFKLLTKLVDLIAHKEDTIKIEKTNSDEIDLPIIEETNSNEIDLPIIEETTEKPIITEEIVKTDQIENIIELEKIEQITENNNKEIEKKYDDIIPVKYETNELKEIDEDIEKLVNNNLKESIIELDYSLFDIKPIYEIIPEIKIENKINESFIEPNKNDSVINEEIEKLKNANQKLTEENNLIREKLKMLSSENILLNKQLHEYKNKYQSIKDFIQYQI